MNAKGSFQRIQAGRSFARRYMKLSRQYWNSERRWRIRLHTGFLVGLTVLQVVTPILLNLWSEKLFNALEERSMDGFFVMLGAAGGILVFHVSVSYMHLIVKRRLQYDWRNWLTRNLLYDWLSRGRHHQISYLGGDHDNPDGRIAEDVRIATEVAIDLAHSLLYCVLLLISFTNILWMLSGAPQMTLFGMTFSVPGYLLYIALAYAAAGTAIAMLVGKPLVDAVNRRQAREASFRFGLARVRENAQVIALLHGESEERNRLFDLLKDVREGWYGQTRALSHMMVFSATYMVLSAVFPILVAAPRYIAGVISLGMLMQTAQAFQQTVAALSWPIDNLAKAAEWKASVERVLSLQEALERLDMEVDGVEGTARVTVDRDDAVHSLLFENVSISDPDGQLIIKPFSAEVTRGERVLISGDAGASLRLFRAVARVWPWGQGRIALPAHTRVFFMPEHPYLPYATLRSALSYPVGPEKVGDTSAEAALIRVGLAHLTPRLDEAAAWDEELAMAEQQRLGFARLLVRHPDWIFIEGATDALDPEAEEEMLRILDEDFPKATLITIGSGSRVEARHRRRLTLERSNGAVRLVDSATPTQNDPEKQRRDAAE